MTQVCFRRVTTTWSLKVDRADERLFMKSAAPTTATAMNGIQKRPAFCR